MGLFKKGGLFSDVIRCDEKDYLIWKWNLGESENSRNKRETSIRFGSILHVKDGEVAVFVYNQKDGVFQDYIEGPFEKELSTKNLPVLTGLRSMLRDGNTPFQAEVYFINLARIIQTKFVIPYFDIFDPRYQDYAVPVAVRGTISFKIADYKDFIKLHRLQSFDLEDFDKQVIDAVSKYVKSTVINAPSINGISVIQIEKCLLQIGDIINNNIHERFIRDFGVIVSEVDVGSIDIDKTNDGYKKLVEVSQKMVYETSMARAETEAKNIRDMQKINVENYGESLRIQREEGAYAQHLQSQTTNIGAVQVEKQTKIGVAGAEALGKMGSNGAGSVNLGEGGNGVGFNPAAMMTGIAMGGVVANNLAGTMQNAMGNTNTTPGAVPPPIPEVVYNVAENGQPTGPFNLATLKQMAQNGKFNRQTLVWKPGMQSWVEASSVNELQEVLMYVPPVLNR